MAEGLDRNEMLSLLNRLGDEDDAVVLSSARDLQARLVAAQVSWDDLLVPDAPPEDMNQGEPSEDEGLAETERDEATDEVEQDADSEEDSDRPASSKRTSRRRTTDTQALKLINQLLERRDISKSLREELSGYKEDINEGEFDDADRNYLRALHRRLSKR